MHIDAMSLKRHVIISNFYYINCFIRLELLENCISPFQLASMSDRHLEFAKDNLCEWFVER